MESISIRNIFLNIWTSPREVFTYIHENDNDRYYYFLLFFAGVALSFQKAIAGDQQVGNLTNFVVLHAIGGGLLGWINLLLYSIGVATVGAFMGGKADTFDILKVIAYAMIPSILGLLLIFPELLIFGQDIFGSGWYVFTGDLWQNLLGAPLILLHLWLQVFSLYLCVEGIAAVMGVSFGEAMAYAIAPFLLLILLVFIVLGIIYIFSLLS